MRCTFAVVAGAMVLAAACAPSTGETLEANKEVVRRFVEATNAMDWETVGLLLADDFHRHSQASTGAEETNRGEYLSLLQSYAEAMPDVKVTVEQVVAEGGLAAIRAMYHGTQTGPMGPFPPSNRTAELRFLGMMRIEGGRISEMWVEWDNLAMLAQLGHYTPGLPTGSAQDSLR